MRKNVIHESSPACLGRANISDSEAGSTEIAYNHKYVASIPRQQPVINADEDSQRRLIAGTRGDIGRQRLVIDADEDSQRQRRLCRSCGAETANDRDRICDACAEALREERAAALAERCRIYRVRYVEDLPVSMLEEIRREQGRC